MISLLLFNLFMSSIPGPPDRWYADNLVTIFIGNNFDEMCYKIKQLLGRFGTMLKNLLSHFLHHGPKKPKCSDCY